LEEVYFLDEVSFSQVAFLAPVRFERVHFAQTQFDNAAYFEQTAFAAPATFTDAAFAGIASFKETTWAQPLSFAGVRFADRALFWDARFAEEVSFDSGRADGEVAFDRARFSGEASFADFTFARAAHFRGATFGQARFDGAYFRQEADFSDSEGRVIRLGAFFNRSLDLSRAAFALIDLRSAGADSTFAANSRLYLHQPRLGRNGQAQTPRCCRSPARLGFLRPAHRRNIGPRAVTWTLPPYCWRSATSTPPTAQSSRSHSSSTTVVPSRRALQVSTMAWVSASTKARFCSVERPASIFTLINGIVRSPV